MCAVKVHGCLFVLQNGLFLKSSALTEHSLLIYYIALSQVLRGKGFKCKGVRNLNNFRMV